MTHEEILSMLGDYVDYLIANSSAEAPMVERSRRCAAASPTSGTTSTAA